MSRNFQKNKEDFICQHCGNEVVGNGYTNHCPLCLWSKHVDHNPGDRENPCQGLMEPVGLETKSHTYIIIHKCTKCGVLKKNKASPEDNAKALIKLSSQLI